MNIYKDIAIKNYTVKEYELMNDDYYCYEFKHTKGSRYVYIKARDCKNNPYGDRKGTIKTTVAIANKFYWKLIADGYKWNTSYVR